MFRNIISLAVQKKFFLMFFTAVIYIVGLFAYFTDTAIITAFIIMIIGLAAILKNYLSPKLVLFWYLMFFFAFFNANLRIRESDSLSQLAPQQAKIEGQIVSIPTINDYKTKFFFKVSQISYFGKVIKIKNAKTLVTLYNGTQKLNVGDSYTFTGKLRTPFEVSNPSQFDYGKYLRNYNTFTLFYTDGKNFKRVDEQLSLKWKFMQHLNNIRNDIIQTHAQYLKSPNLELLGGMVFGDDAISPPEHLKQAFINAGLLHLLAASGMNVALIYGIWFFILNKLRVPFKITVLSGILVIIFYSLMTGLGPSVVRAAIMLIFILLGKLIDRDAHSISLLSFVAILMLIYNPAYINDVGFQLSFLVTFGLLITTPVVFERIKNMPGWLSGAIFIPIIAQIWVAPIQMYYFNSFSLYSVFANILIVPFVTVISFGGFISAVISLIKPLAHIVCFLFDFLLNPILNVVVFISDYFSNLPHSLIQTIQPNVFQLFLYYSLVLFITLSIKYEKHEHCKKMVYATAIIFVALILSFIQTPSHKLETIAFDVQNADAFLIKTPENKYFLIDSGKMRYKNSKTQAKMIILEYLKDRGIKNIQGFIITHFDSDHAGGAVDLINNLNIENVYVNSFDDNSHLAKKIYKNVKNKKSTNLILAKNNQVIYREGNLTLRNFISGLNGEKLENENSIITLVSNGEFDELFMGDSGIQAFGKINRYLPKNIEVLKVGHHGARNVINKMFLDRINPQVAIISTGPNNYGHPNGVTLDILQRHKVKTFRTDRQNSIKIEEEPEQNNKNSYEVYSFEKNSGWTKIYQD